MENIIAVRKRYYDDILKIIEYSDISMKTVKRKIINISPSEFKNTVFTNLTVYPEEIDFTNDIITLYKFTLSNKDFIFTLKLDAQLKELKINQTNIRIPINCECNMNIKHEKSGENFLNDLYNENLVMENLCYINIDDFSFNNYYEECINIFLMHISNSIIGNSISKVKRIKAGIENWWEI